MWYNLPLLGEQSHKDSPPYDGEQYDRGTRHDRVL